MKQLIWYGPPYSYSGYGVHNRSMVFELVKLGWDIRLIPTESYPPKELIGKELLLSLTKKKHIHPQQSIVINLIPPPSVPLYGAYTILSTTLESLTVHQGFFNRCTLFDEVWFPCKFNIRSMIKAKFPKQKLFYCPEGVYPGFWSPDDTGSKKYRSSDFTFFYNGDWSYRKGIDILIRAYAKAFKPTDPVRLLMLVHYQGSGPTPTSQTVSAELPEMCSKHNITRLPKIEFIYEHIPDPELPSIYNCADIYATPTRGEAWGLPIIQAMSCGLPAIVPSWGGHRDYCNRKNSFISKIDKFDIMDDKVHLAVDFYKQQLFCFPNVNHFSKLMRYAFEHQDEVKKKGATAREYLKANFTWSHSAKIADQQLRSIYETKFRQRVHTHRGVHPGRPGPSLQTRHLS